MLLNLCLFHNPLFVIPSVCSTPCLVSTLCLLLNLCLFHNPLFVIPSVCHTLCLLSTLSLFYPLFVHPLFVYPLFVYPLFFYPLFVVVPLKCIHIKQTNNLFKGHLAAVQYLKIGWICYSQKLYKTNINWSSLVSWWIRLGRAYIYISGVGKLTICCIPVWMNDETFIKHFRMYVHLYNFVWKFHFKASFFFYNIANMYFKYFQNLLCC